MSDRKDEIISEQLEIIRRMTERNLKNVGDDIASAVGEKKDAPVVKSAGKEAKKEEKKEEAKEEKASPESSCGA